MAPLRSVAPRQSVKPRTGFPNVSVQLIAERSLTTPIRSQGVVYVLVGCPLSRIGGDRTPGLLAAFVERGELRHAVLPVLLGHDGVLERFTVGEYAA